LANLALLILERDPILGLLLKSQGAWPKRTNDKRLKHIPNFMACESRRRSIAMAIARHFTKFGDMP
jgi:hypothetical protein